MTAEQKLEKCKELVEEWRSRSEDYKSHRPDIITVQTIAAIETDMCIEDLQAVLEETDE